MTLLRAPAMVGLALLLAGCGSRSPGSSASGAPGSRNGGFDADADPDIARIFGDPPPTGQLPSSLRWSPDGQHLAFLRKTTGKDGTPRNELWLHTIAGHKERPLVGDQEISVTWFAWAGSYKIAYAVDGDLFLAGLDGSRRRLTETEAAEEGMQAAPDGTRVAFVRDHDVYAIDITSGTEISVTADGTRDRSYGEVTWVYGEEFDSEAGLGWSPDGARLWIYATDESEVSRRTVITDAAGNTRLQAYPQAGQKNPVVRVGVVDFSKGGESNAAWLQTGEDPDVYLPQVTWHPDGKRLVVVRIDRLQTLLELLLCDAGSGACRAILEERDPRWVNLLGPPVFVGEGEEFLWLSERDGWAHIYRVGLDGTLREQLTEGEWVVTSIDAIDTEEQQVCFTGNPETPTSHGVYRVDLDGGRIDRISPEGGVHSVEFSPDASLFADTHSSLDTPPVTAVYDSAGELRATLRESDLGSYEISGVANDIFPIETRDGETFWAHLTRPLALEPDRRYPVLIYVYGGPHAQVVRDHFRTTFQLWRNLLASRGILVFSMDGRGSAGRGREFEAPIHLRLGEVELEDQLVGVKYLRNQPYVDPNRLAVFGWSYGGTMVLNALLRSPGVFRAGIAVAPVTDWHQYDTAYTERYMQRPEDNPEGYDETSLLPLAGELDVPLLLVHGGADDNVHFANTALLIDAFVEAGKQLDVMIYPGRGHGIRGAKPRTQLFTKITRFLERHL